jgi:hypothetical protein
MSHFFIAPSRRNLKIKIINFFFISFVSHVDTLSIYDLSTQLTLIYVPYVTHQIF